MGDRKCDWFSIVVGVIFASAITNTVLTLFIHKCVSRASWECTFFFHSFDSRDANILPTLGNKGTAPVPTIRLCQNAKCVRVYYFPHHILRIVCRQIYDWAQRWVWVNECRREIFESSVYSQPGVVNIFSRKRDWNIFSCRSAFMIWSNFDVCVFFFLEFLKNFILMY